MAVTKLDLYNLALLELKASPLVSLTEARESRRVLDVHYPRVLAYMLEQGFWNFAMRTVEITQDATITPAFGYSMAFNKPTDWVRTFAISLNERLEPILSQYIEESNLWFADAGPLYVRYVSNSVSGYGYDLTRFTERYMKAFYFELAARSCSKVAGSSDGLKDDLEKKAKGFLVEAQQFEALREPAQMLPQGRWNAGRFARGGDNGRWSGPYRTR